MRQEKETVEIHGDPQPVNLNVRIEINSNTHTYKSEFDYNGKNFINSQIEAFVEWVEQTCRSEAAQHYALGVRYDNEPIVADFE